MAATTTMANTKAKAIQKLIKPNIGEMIVSIICLGVFADDRDGLGALHPEDGDSRACFDNDVLV